MNVKVYGIVKRTRFYNKLLTRSRKGGRFLPSLMLGVGFVGREEVCHRAVHPVQPPPCFRTRDQSH